MRRFSKTFFIIQIIFVLIFIGMITGMIIAKPARKFTENQVYKERTGTAVVITGAAARIVQESALLENLHKNGWFGNVCFISGTSSGAVNTVLLNAILENRISWQRYNSILFNLNNDSIFIRKGRSLPVNNIPYKTLLTHVVHDSLGYIYLGDLPYNSSISITTVDMLPPFSTTYRLSNLNINEESNPGFNLVETLLASTAIPIIFPASKFTESFGLPNSAYVDGGVAEDHIPYQAVLQFEKYRGFGVDTLIIVGRKCGSQKGISNEINDFGNIDSRVFNKLSSWIDNLAMNGFIKSMKELQEKYPELALHTYVFIPAFEENFDLLDFTNMQKQYDVTIDWAELHKPLPLNQFLEEYTLETR